MIVGAGVIVAGAIIGIVIAGRPPTLEDRVAAFSATWKSGSVDDIKKWCTIEFLEEEKRWKRIKSTLGYRGWNDSRPPVESPRIKDKKDTSAAVDFTVLGENFQTRWVLAGDFWKIVTLKLPKLVPARDPPAAAVEADFHRSVESFRSAWNESRLDDIKGMVPQVLTATWNARIDRYAKKYGDRKLESDPGTEFSTRVRGSAEFLGTTGDIQTKWTYDLDRWELTGLRFR